MFNYVNPSTRHRILIGLFVSFLGGAGVVSLVVAQDQQDNPSWPHLSVGTFGKEGRGIRFSGTTFSVNALPGEAPMVVMEESGRAGLAVRPNGDVHIDRNLVVYGQKKFAQPHPNDPQKLISYVALEGPEPGTYVRGTAEVVEGEAVIELPDHFRLTTSDKGLTVTLSPLGQWLQLYVVEKSTARILVREARRKTGHFDYLVQGARAGNEDYQVIGDREY